MEKYVIYTDGGSRGNPGPAGAGWVISDGDGNVLAKNSKFLGDTTNNQAEYDAVIFALKDLKRIVGKSNTKNTEILIKLDSELVGKQLIGEYQIKEEGLFSKFIEVHNIMVKDFPNMKFENVPRSENSIADGLANEAMDSCGK